jgi:hypothetical protein
VCEKGHVSRLADNIRKADLRQEESTIRQVETSVGGEDCCTECITMGKISAVALHIEVRTIPKEHLPHAHKSLRDTAIAGND